MAFVKLSDQTDTIEMVAFPECFTDHKDILVPGTCVAVKGKFSKRNDEPSILIDKLKVLAFTDTVANVLNEPAIL